MVLLCCNSCNLSAGQDLGSWVGSGLHACAVELKTAVLGMYIMYPGLRYPLLVLNLGDCSFFTSNGAWGILLNAELPYWPCL